MIGSPHRLAVVLAAVLAGTWLAAMGLMLSGARLPATSSGRVLAVFAPSLDPRPVAERIAAADGIAVESFGAGLAWIAYSRRAGFVGRLEEQGAVLVIPPLGDLRFNVICGAGMAFLTARAARTTGRAAPLLQPAAAGDRP